MLEKNFGKHRESKIKSPKSVSTYTNNLGQRVSVKRRGQKRYFVYIQERFSDIYCFLSYSIGVPIMKDNFLIEECVFVDKNLENVREFLVSISKQKNKSITFSLNSIKIN